MQGIVAYLQPTTCTWLTNFNRFVERRGSKRPTASSSGASLKGDSRSNSASVLCCGDEAELVVDMTLQLASYG